MNNETLFPPDRVSVMGVLNTTPDSFSDGGRLYSSEEGLLLRELQAGAQRLVEAGAHLLDIGGESTRPGALEVQVGDEIRRTEGAIRSVAASTSVPISIDTRKAEVAQVAIKAGASVINDVSGLSHDPSLAVVAAQTGSVLILGHMQGTPQTMQTRPHYSDLLQEVARDLQKSIDIARAAGVDSEQLVIDPGIGFGKRLEDNLLLIAHAGWFREHFGLPVLIGPSRKAFIGTLTGDPVTERDLPSHAACAVAAFTGADAVRVHEASGALRSVLIGKAIRNASAKVAT